MSLLKTAGTKKKPAFSDAQLRIVTVAFGVGLILLLLLLKDGLGHSATAWAALFLAASPAMVLPCA